MKDKLRRERLGNLLFEVVKYLITIILIGRLLKPESITLKVFVSGFVLTIVLLITAYFITPKNNNEE